MFPGLELGEFRLLAGSEVEAKEGEDGKEEGDNFGVHGG